MFKLICDRGKQRRPIRAINVQKYSTNNSPRSNTFRLFGAVVLGLGAFATTYAIVKFDQEIISLVYSYYPPPTKELIETTNIEHKTGHLDEIAQEPQAAAVHSPLEETTPEIVTQAETLNSEQLGELLQPFHAKVENLTKKIDHIETTQTLETQLHDLRKQLDHVISETIIPDPEQNPDLTQIQEQINFLQDYISKSCAETERQLAHQEQVYHDTIVKASHALMAPLVKETDQIKQVHEQEMEEQQRLLELRIQEIKQKYESKIQQIKADGEKQQLELYQQYMNQIDKIADQQQKEYLAQAYKSLDERYAELESKLHHDWTDIRQSSHEATEHLENLSGTSKAQTEELHAAIEAHRQSLHVLAHIEALLLLQSVQKNSPRPFPGEYKRVIQITANEPQLTAAICALTEQDVTRGIKTIAELREEFDGLGHKVRQHSLKKLLDEPNKGFVSKIVDITKSGPTGTGMIPGTDDAAIISRCGYHLGRSSLEAAIRELDQLDSETAQFYGDWMKDAKARHSLDSAVQLFTAHITQEVESTKQE